MANFDSCIRPGVFDKSRTLYARDFCGHYEIFGHQLLKLCNRMPLLNDEAGMTYLYEQTWIDLEIPSDRGNAENLKLFGSRSTAKQQASRLIRKRRIRCCDPQSCNQVLLYAHT